MGIRKRMLPSGKIVWLCGYTDSAGKRRFKQFDRKRDADDYMIRVGGELRQGTHVAPGASITVAAAGRLWIERAERDQLVTSTVRQYRQHLRSHIEPAIGSLKLSELTVPRVHTFIDDLLKATSRQTTRKVLTSLGSLIDEAIRRGLHSHNPVRSVKLRKPSSEEGQGDRVEMPSKADLRAILNGASGRWRPIILTAAFSGMRGSELRGLQWGDVDLRGGFIHVRRRVDHWGNFGPPKSKAGKRDIPLPPIVTNTLREWRLACPKGDLGLVFPSPSGGILAHACILKDGLGPILLAAGIVRTVEGEARPRYGLHALRHAAAALFIEQGFGPKKVQALMGHASIKMTFDLYGYLFRSEDEDRAAMAQIEARLLKG